MGKLLLLHFLLMLASFALVFIQGAINFMISYHPDRDTGANLTVCLKDCNLAKARVYALGKKLKEEINFRTNQNSRKVQATVCMVCKSFKSGHCLAGKNNCTTRYKPGCRTRNYFLFSHTGKWVHNHTELDCDKACMAENMYLGALKISTFCCKGEDFCNKYHGQVVNKNIY